MNFNLKQSKQSALEMLFSQRSKGKYSCRYLSSWNSKISAWLGQNTSAPYIPKVTLMTISHLAYMLLGESYLFTLLTLFLKLLLWSPLLEYQGLYSQGYLKKGLIPEKKKEKKKELTFSEQYGHSGEEGFSLLKCFLPPSSAICQTYPVITSSTAESQQRSLLLKMENQD